jgi:methylthioribose-1-phosphate isomerase
MVEVVVGDASLGDHIQWTGDALVLLDQRVLPREERWVRCRTAGEAADAIRDMVVRGAPAIGIAAAYGLALAARGGEDAASASARLLAARPTAVNLRWAVERLLALPPEARAAEAARLHREDVAINRALGEVGAALLPPAAVVYTHCNAGALATGGWGTALGVVRSAWEQGRLSRVYAGETRPWLQGARLTAYELARDGIPVTLVADVAAASVLASGRVQAVIVGADRVAANGDTANKVGTCGLAILAQHFRVPFYVAVPTSTLDLAAATGADIPVEERPAAEVLGYGAERWAAEVPVWNPAFDITPASCVTAWITERGLWRPPA